MGFVAQDSMQAAPCIHKVLVDVLGTLNMWKAIIYYIMSKLDQLDVR
jgi:hypothetical protein